MGRDLTKLLHLPWEHNSTQGRAPRSRREGKGVRAASRAQGEEEAAAHLETLLTLNVLSPIANFIAAPDLLRAQGITGTKLQYLGTLRLQFLKSQ